MSSALDRLTAFLVESPAPAVTASLPAACRAAVLGTTGDVVPLAAVLALTLRAADRRPAALVALWGTAPPGPAPTVRAAARLAAAVKPFAATRPSSEARDETGSSSPGAVPRTVDRDEAGSSAPMTNRAIARGRLAWLALPAEPALAVDALVGAAAVVDAPLVTALAGARPAALDDLVAGHDLVVVAAAPSSPLAETAIERLAERGVPAIACRPPARGIARTLAVAGWAAPRIALTARQAVVR
jgi:hypothetical protein